MTHAQLSQIWLASVPANASQLLGCFLDRGFYSPLCDQVPDQAHQHKHEQAGDCVEKHQAGEVVLEIVLWHGRSPVVMLAIVGGHI